MHPSSIRLQTRQKGGAFSELPIRPLLQRCSFAGNRLQNAAAEELCCGTAGDSFSRLPVERDISDISRALVAAAIVVCAQKGEFLSDYFGGYPVGNGQDLRDTGRNNHIVSCACPGGAASGGWFWAANCAAAKYDLPQHFLLFVGSRNLRKNLMHTYDRVYKSGAVRH